MNTTYTTRQGDTWDKIAYQVYGSEQYAGWLMQNNFSRLDIFVFNAGVLLNGAVDKRAPKDHQPLQKKVFTQKKKAGLRPSPVVLSS